MQARTEAQQNPDSLLGGGTAIVHIGDFILHLDADVLELNGEPINLGKRAISVLRELARQPDQLVSKKQLLEDAWLDESGRRVIVEPGSLQVQIFNLRKVLGKESIKTVMDRGYRLTLPVRLPTARLMQFPTPRPLELLIGRDEDEAQLGRLLESHRLLSIVGGPGMGKTSMASQLASRILHTKCQWLELADLRDEESIVRLVAAAAQADLQGENKIEMLALKMAEFRGLIVLDNAEQALDIVARLCTAVLAGSAHVRFLVTSQAPLQTVDEVAYQLQPLAVPEEGAEVLVHAQAAPDPERCDEILQPFPGMRLFLRVARRKAHHEYLRTHLPAIAGLARSLSGNPLAIHHAAAQVDFLDLDNLDKPLELLTQLSSGERGRPKRHRSLHDAFEWGHENLSADSRRVFHALARFPSGASVQILNGLAQELGLSTFAMQDIIRDLLARSFIFKRPFSSRLMIPEALRYYSARRLERGDLDISSALLDRALVRAVMSFAGNVLSSYLRSDYSEWQERYQQEWDNLRAAIEAAVRNDLAAETLIIACASWAVWRPDGKGYWVFRLRKIITPELLASLPAEVTFHFRRMRALTLLDGGADEMLNNPDDHARLSRPDSYELIYFHSAAAHWLAAADLPAAQAHFRHALELAEQFSLPPVLQCLLLQTSAQLSIAAGDPQRACADMDRCLPLSSQCGPGTSGFTLLQAALCAAAAKDSTRLASLWQATLSAGTAVAGRQQGIILGYFLLGYCRTGEAQRAREALRVLLTLAEYFTEAEIFIMDGLALFAQQHGEAHLAARLYARCESGLARSNRVRDALSAEVANHLLQVIPASLIQTSLQEMVPLSNAELSVAMQALLDRE